jgi:hypothetical protein
MGYCFLHERPAMAGVSSESYRSRMTAYCQ